LLTFCDDALPDLRLAGTRRRPSAKLRRVQLRPTDVDGEGVQEAGKRTICSSRSACVVADIVATQ
jgi:hypothetical protein